MEALLRNFQRKFSNYQIQPVNELVNKKIKRFENEYLSDYLSEYKDNERQLAIITFRF